MSNEKEFIISSQDIKEFQEKHNITPIRPIEINNYPLFSIEEMDKNKPNPIEYIFYPCLPTQGIGWIYAATGICKTLFTLNLAYSMASGGRFLKYSCPIPRKVLYVDGEMAYNQLYSRIKLAQKVQGELDFQDNLKFLTPDKIFPFSVPKIDEPEGQFIYEELLKRDNFEVIIFDNLSMLSSFDEKDISQWKPIANWLVKLRSMGKSVIMIHHAGKDIRGYRGASNMMDCADFAISLQPLQENDLEEDLVNVKKFKVMYSKNRNFFGEDALPYEVNLIDGIWTHQSMEKSEMQMLVEMHELNIPQVVIAKEFNCSQSKVAKLVKKAKKLGLIKNKN